MNLLPASASPSRPYWELIDPSGLTWETDYGWKTSDQILADFFPEDFGLEKEPGDGCVWRLMLDGKGVVPAWDDCRRGWV